MSSNGKSWNHRPYRITDREACLRIFDSNSPSYFLADERDIFAQYLDKHAEGYRVVETAEKAVIACGGFVIGLDGGAASLCWGMVDKEWHGKGLGKYLLTNRLASLAQIPKMKLIRMDTSQRSVEFFMKAGFKTYRITQNYYGPGFHRHEMYLILDDEKIREVLTFNPSE